MPVGSVGKWLVLGTLVATLGAGGCKEDDEEPTPPVDSGHPATDAGGGGGTDSGATDSGAKDAGGGGTDAGMDAGVKCGTPPMDCTGHTTGLGPVAPGCAKNYQDAEVCGISSMTVLNGAEPKFLEKNAPGVASPACGAIVDMGEPAPDGGVPDGGMALKGNGKIDTTITVMGTLMIALQYPGCCTKAGFCSGDGKMGKASLAGGAYNDSDNGYGCMQSEIFFRSQPTAQHIPCDPVTGALMLPDAGGGGADGGTDAGATDAGADGGNS